MFPASRITDLHACLLPAGPVTGPCAPTVLIGNLPAARVTDMCTCLVSPDPIVMGSMKVLIMNLPAARITSTTALGGAMVSGFPTVLIGG
jgi:uncharacterized Zn-binding protein involved in type VI secretion